MLVSNPTNIFYLTEFRGLEPQEREAYALVTPDAGAACGDLVAANMLAEPLIKSQAQLKELDTKYLAAVQRRRELPTRFIQVVQTQIQRRVLASVLRSEQPLAPPRWLRLLSRVPLVRRVPARIFGLGLWPVRVKKERSTHEHGS
jgi:hypothetical protein